MYAARTRNGFRPVSRAELFKKLKPLEISPLLSGAAPTLFPPQSDKGIHSGGALRRQQAGEERDSHE